MSHSRLTGFLFGLIFLGTFETALVHAENSLSPAEKKAGWVLLFDGKDKYTHWRIGESGVGTPNTWLIQDSAMVSQNSGAMLFTKESYTDFEWQADWKLSSGGNSGLFIRVQPNWICSGFEYAILDDSTGEDNGKDGNNLGHVPGETLIPIKRTGANYDLYPTTQDAILIPNGGKWIDIAKPYNEWNHGVIWANGNFIEHWLNGQKVVAYEIGSPDWTTRYHLSKFYKNLNCGDQWSKYPTGSIGVQDHGVGLITYIRNLKIRPFTKGDTLVSPMAAPNGGNFSATVKVGLETAITGSAIHYTVDGSDPIASSPIYTDSLVLSATTTLKAITTRDKFKNSSVTSAVFTKAGSFIIKKDLSPNPEAAISTLNNGLIILNKNGQRFSGKVLSPLGQVVYDFEIGASEHSKELTGLKPGIFLVKIKRGDWGQTQKVVVP